MPFQIDEMNRKDFYVTADDVGIIESVDRAVEKLINKGIVNNISIFINSELDYSWIKKYSSHLNISLHLTFSYGKPLSDKKFVPALIDNKGYFKKPIKPLNGTSKEIEKSIERYLLFLEKEVPEIQLERECLAQFKRFCEEFGRKPDFINVHHDLDKAKKICNVIKRCLPTFPTRQMLLQNQKWGGCFYDFYPEDLTFSQVYRKITDMLEVAHKINQEKNVPVEVIFHPAYFSVELQQFSSYAKAREKEYDVLIKL